MKKNTIWTISLLVVLLMIIAACGGAAPAPESEAPAAEEPAAEEQAAEEPAAEEPAEEAAEEPAEEPAAEVVEGCTDPLGCITVAPGDPLKIASALVTSGPNETLGLDSQYGVEVAIMDRGEVAGHPLELVAEDGQCSAEGGQTASTKIASDSSIVGVVGHNCSSSCTPAAPIYNDAGFTMISPSCTAPALTGEGSHVDSFLRTAHNDNTQGRVMAEFVFNELGLTKAATIHDGSPYAEQLQQVFADTFVELGGEITAQEAINIGDTDMRPVLTSIATGGPEIIYYPIFIAEGGFISTQAQEISGLENVVRAGADGMISPDFVAAAGEAAEGMYMSGPSLEFSGDRYDQFLADYKEISGQDPLSAFHAHAYDAANMIFDAVEAVAQTDADGNTLIGRQALRDALYATSGFDGITGNLSCNEMGDCADPQIAVNQIQGGQYVPIYATGKLLGEVMAEGEAGEEAMAEEGEEAMEAPAELPDLDGRSISIAIENAYLPFNYIDLETGEAAGWDYDVWDEICVRLNCVPDYIEARWDGMIVAVSQGQFDAAADGITITEDRAKVVDFSDGYIAVEQRLLARLEEDRYASVDEFVANDALLLGTQVGTTNYESGVKAVGAERITTFDDFGLVVQALIAGDVDGVIIDETAGLGYQGVNADKVKLVEGTLSSDQLGFIYPKGSDLVEPVNAALASMKADGFLQQVNDQYFGPNFTITYDDIADVTYEDEPAEEGDEQSEHAEDSDN